MAPDVFILNGPNLNLLGQREPHVYGTATLAEIEALCLKRAAALGFAALHFRQSNHEGELIDWLHEAGARKDPVIMNPGAYTHTSIALHDAIKAAEVYLIEVHLSNIHAREAFRHHSYVSPAASGVIVGLGVMGYLLGLEALASVFLNVGSEKGGDPV